MQSDVPCGAEVCTCKGDNKREFRVIYLFMNCKHAEGTGRRVSLGSTTNFLGGLRNPPSPRKITVAVAGLSAGIRIGYPLKHKLEDLLLMPTSVV
jgi:hypothetical protein